MHIHFVAMPTEAARALQKGGPDAYGNPPERRVSDGGSIPCRHCLKPVAAGEPYLVLAYCPFPAAQPYAETGPVFLHEGACERFGKSPAMPEIFHGDGTYILRGYDADDRIRYDAAEIVTTCKVKETAAALLARQGVAYLHMRSSRYNCFQCRIDRA